MLVRILISKCEPHPFYFKPRSSDYQHTIKLKVWVEETRNVRETKTPHNLNSHQCYATRTPNMYSTPWSFSDCAMIICRNHKKHGRVTSNLRRACVCGGCGCGWGGAWLLGKFPLPTTPESTYFGGKSKPLRRLALASASGATSALSELHFRSQFIPTRCFVHCSIENPNSSSLALVWH